MQSDVGLGVDCGPSPEFSHPIYRQARRMGVRPCTPTTPFGGLLWRLPVGAAEGEK